MYTHHTTINKNIRASLTWQGGKYFPIGLS